MSNVRPLFPNVSDEEYEDHMLPPLIEAMGLIWEQINNGDHDIMFEISSPLMQYVWHSLDTLDTIRRNAGFDGNKLPESVARTVDDLIAESARAMGGRDSLVATYKKRSPTKRKSNFGRDDKENE